MHYICECTPRVHYRIHNTYCSGALYSWYIIIEPVIFATRDRADLVLKAVSIPSLFSSQLLVSFRCFRKQGVFFKENNQTEWLLCFCMFSIAAYACLFLRKYRNIRVNFEEFKELLWNAKIKLSVLILRD